MLWSSNNTIIHSSVKSNTAYSVYLLSSHNTTLVENGIIENEYGVYLQSFCNNNITHNNIQYKEYDTTAIHLESSNSNIIYDNNFYTSNIKTDD